MKKHRTAPQITNLHSYFTQKVSAPVGSKNRLPKCAPAFAVALYGLGGALRSGALPAPGDVKKDGSNLCRDIHSVYYLFITCRVYPGKRSLFSGLYKSSEPMYSLLV